MFKKIIEKLFLANKNNQFYFDPVFKCRNILYLYKYFLKKYKKKKLILLFADCENLKVINDTYGHNAGDKYLQSVVDELSQFGSVIRMGGDEFLVVIEKEEKLKDFLKIKHDEYSYGVVIKKTEDDILDKIREADSIMYENKRKNKYNKSNTQN